MVASGASSGMEDYNSVAYDGKINEEKKLCSYERKTDI